MRKTLLLAASACAAMFVSVLPLQAAPAKAVCTVSNSTPEVNELITFSATGLRGGYTNLTVTVLQENEYVRDFGTIGQVDSYSFDWTAAPVGATITARFTTTKGELKCESRVQVANSA